MSDVTKQPIALPCPFDGGEGMIEYPFYPSEPCVMCTKCGTYGPRASTVEKAVAAWNAWPRTVMSLPLTVWDYEIRLAPQYAVVTVVCGEASPDDVPDERIRLAGQEGALPDIEPEGGAR